MKTISKPYRTSFTKTTLFLFYAISAYLVFPFIEVPLLGLSISAPLFFVVVLETILRSPHPWTKAYRPFIMLAVCIWIAIFLSAIVNGLLSGGMNINRLGVLTVIRYVYWLIIFIVVAYVVTSAKLSSNITTVMGWSVVILAVLRWGEALVFGSIGSVANLRVMAQNSYGFQFSAFSTYILGIALQEKGWKKIIAVAGNILLWGAVAINGSRGSWVGVGVSLGVMLFIRVVARQRGFLGLAILLVMIGSSAFVIFSASPQISQTVKNRLDTFQGLENEKSYMIRVLMNQKSLSLFKQSPVFGVGAGRFTTSFVELDIPKTLQYSSQERFNRKSAHNSYLSFLAENGLVGAIPYSLLLLTLTISGLKAAISLMRQNQYWGAAIYTGFIGMSVHMWVISALTTTATWFVYGLVVGMIIVSQTIQAKEE